MRTFPRKRPPPGERRSAHLGRPLAPGAHQREIQAQADRLGAESPGQQGIALKLRSIALDLAVEELLEAAADVLARFVVDDPAHSLAVDKTPIEDHSCRLAGPAVRTPQMARQSVFADILTSL